MSSDPHGQETSNRPAAGEQLRICGDELDVLGPEGAVVGRVTCARVPGHRGDHRDAWEDDRGHLLVVIRWTRAPLVK